MNKLLLSTLIVTILLTILGWLFLTYIAPYAIIAPQRVNDKLDLKDYKLKGDKINITTKDSINLVGYHVKVSENKKGTMILIHGIGGCKEHMLSLSAQLAKRGYESILFDLRAHGESGGQYCTYGYYEKNDISEVVDYIKRKSNTENELPIGIWGNSLGGAIAIQTLELDKRISFGIVESTFTELDQIVIDYQKKVTYGVGIKALTDYSLSVAGKIANFAPTQVKPILAVKNIKQPVLIAHGDADDNISVDYGKALYNALNSTEKELVIVPGGQHWGLFEKGGQKYADQLFGFVENQMIKSSQK